MKSTFVQRLAASLVSRPLIYDLVQNLVGQRKIASRLQRALRHLPSGRALDVGSASGGMAFRLGLSPVCVDIDCRPLRRLLRRRRTAIAVAWDAAHLPFEDQTFDLTLTIMVLHHLDDSTASGVLPELARVTAGHLLFLEPLRNDRRLISRVLWRYDRGRHPRTREQILERLQERFQISQVEEFSIYHEYLLCVATPHNGHTRPWMETN